MGMLSHMFRNQALQQRLHHLMGLPAAETAFGCAFAFLFRNQPKLRDHILHLKRRMKNKRIIGIHIRTGDGYLFDQSRSPLLRDFESFFTCAQQIESSFMNNISTKDIVWYLASDSAPLKEAAQQAFPTKIVTSTGPLMHSTLSGSDTPESARRNAFVLAAAEMHMLGAAEYRVISLKSGFGRLSAFLSFQDHTTFTLLPGTPRDCSHRPDSFAYLASLAPGI
jgi:hypothetical protein